MPVKDKCFITLNDYFNVIFSSTENNQPVSSVGKWRTHPGVGWEKQLKEFLKPNLVSSLGRPQF